MTIGRWNLSRWESVYPFLWIDDQVDPSPCPLILMIRHLAARLMAYLRNGEWNSTSYASLQKELQIHRK